MLRKRVIAVLTFNDGILFRTKLFRPDYRYTVNFVDAWSIDEIVILDVTRDNNGDQESFLGSQPFLLLSRVQSVLYQFQLVVAFAAYLMSKPFWAPGQIKWW